MLFIYTLVCPIFFKGPLKYISSLLPFLSYFYGEKRIYVRICDMGGILVEEEKEK